MTDHTPHDPIQTFIGLLRVEFAKFELTVPSDFHTDLHIGINECLWSAQHAYVQLLNERLEEQLKQQRERNK